LCRVSWQFQFGQRSSNNIFDRVLTDKDTGRVGGIGHREKRHIEDNLKARGKKILQYKHKKGTVQ